MKRGHIADRDAAARFAREQRARFPMLHGGWTRSEWNRQVLQAAQNKLAALTKARREAAKVVPFASVDRIASDEAREAMKQQQALYRQVDAQMRDPVLSHLYD